jgi:lipoate-protein ligase B
MNLADGTIGAVRRFAKTFGTAARPNLHVRWLGRTEFAHALAQQEELAAKKRQDGSLEDQLLLLEHEPV